MTSSLVYTKYVPLPAPQKLHQAIFVFHCEPVTYMMMKCIKFVEHVNKEKLVDTDTDGKFF